MSSEAIRIAVVGVGYFGSAHCRKIASLPEARLSAVVDLDFERARRVAADFGAEPLASHRELIGRVDAAVVAVPTSEHVRVAGDLLEAGLSVLVEKPLAVNTAQAEELCRLAARRSLHLQVGHLERFNPAFIEAAGRIRAARYVRMERCSPFPGRGVDVDVLLDMMIHDLDLLLQLARSPVRAISAAGWSQVSSGLDLATARLEFEEGLLAEVWASRVGAKKVRGFCVVDSEGVLEVDLAAGRLCRTRAVAGKPEPEEIQIQMGDPLLDQDREFVKMLCCGGQPRVGGEDGKAAVALAERISESIARKAW